MLPSSIGMMGDLPYISVAINGFTSPIHNLANLDTLGFAYNPGINGTLEIVEHLPKLKVLFARECSLAG